MNNKPTPRTDAVMQDPLRDGNDLPELARQLENELSEALRERDEAREVIRQIWQSGDAFLPYIDEETTNRWRKAAGLEETNEDNE